MTYLKLNQVIDGKTLGMSIPSVDESLRLQSSITSGLNLKWYSMFLSIKWANSSKDALFLVTLMSENLLNVAQTSSILWELV